MAQTYTKPKDVRLDNFTKKLMEEKNFAFIATLNPDGSPQVTPVWIDTDGKYVYINTAIGRLKQKNTRRDPRVAIAITDQSNPYSYAAIRGLVVEQISGQAAEDHIDKLAKKYMGVKKYPYRQKDQPRIILKIKPERVLARQ